MKYEEITLSNGLCYKGYQNSDVHSVNMSLYFRAGVLYENSHVHGISHLLEHLFFRRMGGMNQKELYYQMEKIGSTLRASTYSSFIRFDISVSPKYFYPAFQIISQIFADNEWTEEDIEKEKAVVMKQIAFKSSPSFSDYINDRYFKGTAMSRPIMGTVESVKRISLKTVNLWRNKVFCPSNSCFVITGNFSNEYNEYAKNTLSNFLNTNKSLNRYSSMPKDCFQRDDKSDFIIDTDYNISDISITFDVRSNNCFQAEFLSSIIGGGAGSRLALILREDLAITDEVYSNVDILSLIHI